MHHRMVGSYEAKTHLPALLDSVSHGESVIITRKGVPIALLTPYGQEKPPVEETIQALMIAREKLYLNGLSIRDMRDEGKRL
jgi:prevent-host-death family protein